MSATTRTDASYRELARKYGTVEIKYLGLELTFWLTDRAELSNSVFDGWFGDAQEGESYIAEYCSPAIDMHGDHYKICWQFEAVKGEEPEPDTYPFDNDHISHIHQQ